MLGLLVILRTACLIVPFLMGQVVRGRTDVVSYFCRKFDFLMSRGVSAVSRFADSSNYFALKVKTDHSNQKRVPCGLYNNLEN